MSLAALVKTLVKSNGQLVPALDAHLITQSRDDRRDGKFHPSDLAGNFCPRAWALYNYHPKAAGVASGAVTPRLARIFGNGSGVHSRIQGYLQSMGILFGTYTRWIGNVGVEVHRGFPPGGDGWTFVEVGLSHPEDNIVGHTDGLIKLDGRKLGVEIKSIKHEFFRWLGEKPNKAHEEQALIYMHCLEHARADLAAVSPKTDVLTFLKQKLEGFIVLYESKNTQELKEYFVPFDKVRIEELMEKKRKRMKQALSYKETGEWPDCLCGRRVSAICQHFEDLL
jgi:hypothetical protein